MLLTENLLTGKAMKNLRIILGIAAFSMLTSACINEVELPSREQENRLTATIESSPETRTSLSPEKGRGFQGPLVLKGPDRRICGRRTEHVFIHAC